MTRFDFRSPAVDTVPRSLVPLASQERSGWQRIPWATWVTGAVIVGSAIAATVWLLGHPGLLAWGDRVAAWQTNPPWWVTVPQSVRGQQWLMGLLVLLGGVLVWATRQDPGRSTPARVVVAAVLVALNVRYGLWRLLTTLDTGEPLSGVITVAVLLVDLPFVLNNVVVAFAIVEMRDRRREASRAAIAVREGHYCPSVDVLIPTVDEPLAILRRTVVGCQWLDYDNYRVWLLDDGDRPLVRQLATELGCEYLSRAERRHAKAGNLNHALAQSDGELVAVFDADFVPTRNFLQRTVGLFQRPKVALVQTYQHFYNPDPVVRNLGLGRYLTTALEQFSRYVGPLREGMRASMCSGTSFVVRRSALAEVGNFVTASLGEDYLTGVALSARGYEVMYLDEGLSAGLSAESIAAYVAQFQRWGTGSMQAFFLPENPLTIPGLTLRQRLGHFQGVMFWFSCFPLAMGLLLPLTQLNHTVMPVATSWQEWGYFFMPLYVAYWVTMGWLSRGASSMVLGVVYGFVTVFTNCVTVLQTLMRPFARGFRVTPKGIARDRTQFQAQLVWPLMVAWLVAPVGVIAVGGRHGGLSLQGMSTPEAVTAVATGLLLAMNWMLLGLAILAFVDRPKSGVTESFQLRRPMQLTSADGQCWVGETRLVSEVGAEVAIADPDPWGLQAVLSARSLTLEILDADLDRSLRLAVEPLGIREVTVGGDPEGRLRLRLVSPTLAQYRQLIHLLYCRPGQWSRRQAPGEWAMLGILVRSLLRPKCLDRRGDLEDEAIALR